MASDPPRPATIRDVARLSGVSIATVTRTFQDSPRVRPETGARVRAAAERLGYRPDSVAQALVRGRSNTIGLLIPSLMQAYWSEVADEIEHRAGERGYSLVLASSRGEPEREHAMLDMLYGKRVDGVIVGGVAGNPDTWPSAGSRSPLVLIEWDATPQWERLRELTERPLGRSAWALAEQRIAGSWFAHLSADDIAGSTLVARHLLDKGHTRIAFLIGPPVRTYLLRLLGTRSAVEEAGHALAGVAADEDTFEGGRAMATKLLGAPQRPTALVCCSDVIAVGAVRAAHELGLDVPGDVSVVGYDDIELAAYLDPPLTTLRNPKRELGDLALDLVLSGREGTAGPIVERLTGELIVRGSTAPPREVGAPAAAGAS
ncbi:MAG TPA: LacI family DNA-binding transcriptional regulator [Conexibacter sp.]|jgi:LacI family transcriptional regulator|nr:LacI family DNA-binding transcriptional regulator [Conexibacter sp.]